MRSASWRRIAASCHATPCPAFGTDVWPCRSDQRGQGLGGLLLGCAVDWCLKAREQVAAFALLVDAKDDGASAFYQHFGFAQLLDTALMLYLPLAPLPGRADADLSAPPGRTRTVRS